MGVWNWGSVIDREVGADKLISKCPSVSRASRGRCLTALTDESCQGDVCNIEQELKFSMQEVEKCWRGRMCLILTAVYIDSGCGGLLWCISSENSYFHYLLNFPLVLVVFIFEWNKLSMFFYLEGKKTLPHITDEAQRGCETLLGKTCPWTGCVNDWTGRQEKIMQHLLSVFWLACAIVEHEWHLRFISAWKCVCGEGNEL